MDKKRFEDIALGIKLTAGPNVFKDIDVKEIISILEDLVEIRNSGKYVLPDMNRSRMNELTDEEKWDMIRGIIFVESGKGAFGRLSRTGKTEMFFRLGQSVDNKDYLLPLIDFIIKDCKKVKKDFKFRIVLSGSNRSTKKKYVLDELGNKKINRAYVLSSFVVGLEVAEVESVHLVLNKLFRVERPWFGLEGRRKEILDSIDNGKLEISNGSKLVYTLKEDLNYSEDFIKENLTKFYSIGMFIGNGSIEMRMDKEKNKRKLNYLITMWLSKGKSVDDYLAQLIGEKIGLSENMYVLKLTSTQSILKIRRRDSLKKVISWLSGDLVGRQAERLKMFEEGLKLFDNNEKEKLMKLILDLSETTRKRYNLEKCVSDFKDRVYFRRLCAIIDCLTDPIMLNNFNYKTIKFREIVEYLGLIKLKG